jgi:hypothetical protein
MVLFFAAFVMVGCELIWCYYYLKCREFLSAVHRIFIYPKEKTGKLNPVSPNPSPSE